MLNGAKAYEAVAEYNSVTQQSDFTEYSQAGAKSYTIDTSGTLADIAKSYEEERLKEGFNNQNLVAAFWNILDKYPELAKSDVDIYDIDNNIAPGSFKNFDGFIKAMRGDIGTGGYGGYTFMTENGEIEYAVIGEMDQTERSVYNYLFAKNGVSNADDYLTKLSSCFYDNNLNYRRGKTLYSEIEKGSFGETVYGIKSSLQRHTDDILAALGGYDDGGYVTVSPRQYAQGMVDENLTGIRQFISDLLGTTAYMIPSIVTSMAATALTGSDQVGSVVGAAVIGLSSSGGAYNEARQLGYSHEEARTYAALTGASEAGLQYVLGGISKLGGKLTGSGITKLASKFDGAFAKFAINLGGKMASEGLEEYLQEVISPVIKNISFSTDEEIDLLSSDALYAALLGAVSAGLLESVDAYRSSKAEIVFKELIDMGKKASPDSEAYKLANELSDKHFSEIKPEQINQLSEAVAVEANNNRHKKAAEIESQLVEKGETGDTERIAWAAVNLLSGAKISEVEQNLIKNSPAAKSIISEITGFPIGADTDVNIESSTAPDNAKKSNVSVDIKDENGYNSERGENYAATDEFRRLQEESKGMSDEEIQLYHSGEREVNEELRKNISGILRSQIDAARNGVRNDYGILNLSAKGNQFNLYENVNGNLFRDCFEIARNYLKNGELVDLHGVNTTDDGIGYNDCFNYLSEDGLSGFSITPDGDLISVFNASGKPGFLNAIAPIVKEKVKTLDCYNSSNQPLMGIYSKVFGFKTASVMDYNMEYDHDNIAENHGSPQVAFMVNTDAEVETKHFTKDQYDEAKEYRDGFVKSESADSSESASFMPETKSVLPDVSAADGETDSYEAFTKRYNGTLELTEDQRTIQSICKALGTEAVFENLDRWVTGKDGKRRFFSPDGYFDKATGKIYINTSTNGKHNPLLFVIKHELTHFGEINKNAYDSFVKAVKESKEFKAWLEHKTGMKGETVDIMAAKLGADIRDERSKYGVDVGVAESEQEVIANFAGDILFAKSGKTLDSLLNSVEAKQKPKVIQLVADFFRWLREKLSGNKDLTFQLQRLESKYTAMLKSTQKSSENTNSTGEGGKEYSFAGERAATADKSLLEIAKQRTENGEDSETVRKETGWFKGYDGKWRFEIDDSNIKYYPGGDALFTKEHPEYAEYRNLEKKFIYGTLTDEENNRLKELNEIWGREHNRLSELLTRGVSKLRDIIDHDVLFKNYPQLEKTTVVFDDLPEGSRGEYDNKQNKIILSNAIRNSNKTVVKTLIHEVQHAVQHIEGFATGSNTDYWANNLLDNALKEKNQIKDEILEKADSIAKDTIYMYDEYIERLSYKGDISESEFAKAYDRAAREISDKNIEELFFDYAEANEKYYFLKKSIDTKSMIAYRNTAGEIEARDVSNRLDYTSEQRRNTRPDIDRTDVVFADGSVSSFLSKGNESDSKRLIQLIQENINEIPKNSLYDISGDGIIDGVKSRYILDIFDMQGNTAYRKDLGTIELTESGAESTIFHGFGKNKLIAAKGIKNVIENGKIISKIENYQNKGNTRYVIAGYGTINNLDSIMAVAINEYVAENGRKSFYLHEIMIKNKDASPFMAEQQKTVSAGKASFDTTVPQKEQSVKNNSMQETREYSISEEVDTEQETDYTAEFDKVTEQFEKGDITRAEFIEQVKALYTQAGETYGTIPKGETVTGNENFNDPVPKRVNGNKKVRQFARTIIEGGGLTEEMLSVTKQQILSGELSYTPTSNERNMAAANRAIEGGHADELWMKTVACEEAPNSTTIATGEALAKLAFDRKDTVKAVQLVAELCEVGTRTAQALQAFSLLKRMGGIGQLYYVQKAVNTLNHDLKTRFKDKAPDIKINETLAEQLAESKTEEDFAISYTAIMNDISAQVPSTFLDKWNAWRYMAMLANPTTHIRNINGNLMFYPFVKTKDVIASGLEHIFLRGDNADKRTKSVIISKDYKQFAKNDFRNVEEIITGSGKMNPKRGIADNRPIFKTKVLESIRKFNFDLLEKEDAIFLKKHYTRALGGYLQAQNIDLKHVSSDILAKAREYAILEAQKATFRDLNKIANAISRFSNSHLLLNLFVEGVLPFKKTPLNIVKRGIEYSPLGLIKALTKGSYDLKKGNISASQFIDGIAGGLTGTGIMLVGMLLSSLGIVKGGFGDDEEDGYNRLMGEQEYSVELFGISYTIDWAAPACIPFFMGVAINESMESEGNYNWEANLGKTALAGLEPIINLSMLSGIQETIASARYADGKEIVLSVVGNVIGSYFSQALPTIGGKIANTIDDTRRTNYIDKSSNMPILVQSAINTVKAKVPGLSMTRPEYVDAWGETQDKGNLALRIFQNFLSPGYVSSVEVTDIDNELKRLAGETGEQSVFPDRADKKFKFKNYTKYLSADEYVEYATMKGQMSADYINELIHSDGYSSLTDEQKVEVINNLYALANAKAKSRLYYTYDEINAMHDGKITEEMYNKYNDSTKRAVAEMHFLEDYKKPINMENNGYSAVDYYISQAKIKKKK